MASTGAASLRPLPAGLVLWAHLWEQRDPRDLTDRPSDKRLIPQDPADLCPHLDLGRKRAGNSLMPDTLTPQSPLNSGRGSWGLALGRPPPGEPGGSGWGEGTLPPRANGGCCRLTAPLLGGEQTHCIAFPGEVGDQGPAGKCHSASPPPGRARACGLERKVQSWGASQSDGGGRPWLGVPSPRGETWLPPGVPLAQAGEAPLLPCLSASSPRKASPRFLHPGSRLQGTGVGKQQRLVCVCTCVCEPRPRGPGPKAVALGIGLRTLGTREARDLLGPPRC